MKNPKLAERSEMILKGLQAELQVRDEMLVREVPEVLVINEVSLASFDFAVVFA